MTASDFKTELKKLCGGYLFCGEEDYLKRLYLSSARKELVPDGDIFNHIILNGDNFSFDALDSAITSLPVMSEKKLIEISGIGVSDMSESEMTELCSVLDLLPMYEYNVLILYAERNELDCGTVKQPSQLLKRLSEHLKSVVFTKESPARVASWVAKHFAAEKIIACPNEVNFLLSRCGCDMSVLASEIDKLCSYLKSQNREKLTENDIRFVSSESKEIAAFDFANAILNGNCNSALSVLNELKLQKEKPEIILSGISRVLCDLLLVKSYAENGLSSSVIAKKLKMHEYKTGLYFRAASDCSSEKLSGLLHECYNADALIKSTPLDSYTVLDRLAVISSAR